MMHTVHTGIGSDLSGQLSIRTLLTRWQARDEQRQMQAQAAMEREFVDSLFLRAPAPMIVLSGNDLVIELANDAAGRLLEREPVRGLPLGAALPEIEEQGCAAMLRETIAGGSAAPLAETSLRLERDGRGASSTPRYWTCRCRRLSSEGSGKARVLAAFADVTAEVERAHAMEIRAAEAELAVRAKDEFLAVLGHELRGPLSPIVSALQRVRVRGIRLREHTIIERQVRHIVRLVDDLLDVGRIGRRALSLRKRVVGITEVVNVALEMVDALLRERNQRVVVDVPEGLDAEIDPDRISQVLCNLLGNAAKFSPKHSQIELVARETAQQRVRLTVIDHGVGIPAHRLNRIFDGCAPAGAAAVPSPQGAGLGLGLTIVRDLVRLHGGEVCVHSAGPCHGSEFVVELPRRAVAQDLDEAAAESPPCCAARS